MSDTKGIVIATHNDSYYLANMITSIINQHRKPDIVTLVSDGCDDAHGKACLGHMQDLRDNNVPCDYIWERENRGPQKALNRGIACTHTDWISALAVDDMLHLNYFSELEAVEDQCDILAVGYSVFGEYQLDYVEPCGSTDYKRDLTIKNCIHGMSPFRRKLWEKHPFRDTPIFDWAFWLDCANSDARILRRDKPLVAMRVREDSFWMKHQDKQEEYRQAMLKAIDEGVH